MIHSPTCCHALRALIYLAHLGSARPVLVRQIAEAAGVPRQSLAKILHGLRNKGLVRSTKGPGGGYQLARPGNELRVADVVLAIDGQIDLSQHCVLGLDPCSDAAPCGLHPFWKRFRDEYFQAVSTMTLADAGEIVARKQSLFPDAG